MAFSDIRCECFQCISPGRRAALAGATLPTRQEDAWASSALWPRHCCAWPRSRPAPTSPPHPAPPPLRITPSTAQLDALFDEAARDYGVPAGLLKSIGYVETRWQMVRGDVEFPGQEPAYGVMALRGENLRKGAALAEAGRARGAEPGARQHPRRGRAAFVVGRRGRHRRDGRGRVGAHRGALQRHQRRGRAGQLRAQRRVRHAQPGRRRHVRPRAGRWRPSCPYA